ncbi:response regulator transcription factor [Herpetosiphon llansteffanensis]|uniref:response regulator transcription factor n=1 Tax=Herpetosiphon llansteffanensis TaxID=2094568 RepID=UPI000D7BC39B|nr:response regulator transcription factor [Herpetosiphon llansteffanensis]
MELRRAFVADDDLLFGDGLISMLDRLGYTTKRTISINDAIATINAESEAYDLAFVDLLMPMDSLSIQQDKDAPHGTRIITHLKEHSPTTGIVVVTSYRWLFKNVMSLWAKRLGGIIGVEKGSSIAIYRQAIDAARQGKTQLFSKDLDEPLAGAQDIFLSLLDPNLVPRILEVAGSLDILGSGEKKVAQLMAWRPEHIAKSLVFSVETVTTYKRNIYSKLDLYDTNEGRETLIFLASVYQSLGSEAP